MAGKWTDEQLGHLNNQYGKVPVKELAEALGRTVPAVQTRAESLGLKDDRARGLWTDEEVAFLRANYLTLGAEGCAKQLGRTKASVHGKIRKVGGGRPSIGPRVVWTEKELEFLRENYQTMGIDELVREMGRTKEAIYVRAQMIDIQRYVDPYPFFETWTEESAYVVGFFAADGWASKRGPESIRIGFGQKDADILFAIKKAIGVGNVYVKQDGMHQYYVQSVRVYERLCEIFGHDVCNKSHTLQWPSVPDEFARHFLRGAVDGDGSLFWRKPDDLWGLGYTTSSRAFITALVENIERLTGIQTSAGHGNHQSWQFRVSGIKAVCLADWLYRDATIALERKAELARQMMESTGTAYGWVSLTPKMRALFPHILERYEVVERVGQ